VKATRDDVVLRPPFRPFPPSALAGPPFPVHVAHLEPTSSPPATYFRFIVSSLLVAVAQAFYRRPIYVLTCVEPGDVGVMTVLR
jgi:hypothetical protein